LGQVSLAVVAAGLEKQRRKTGIMKLADLIVTEARGRGIRHMLGLPGSGFPLDMIESGRAAGVEYVHVAHESTAAIAAAYYGTMKGTAGLCSVIKGVGAGNLVGGVINTYFERLPAVCIAESPASTLGRREMVQVMDQESAFEAAAKYQVVMRPETAPESVRTAVREAIDGRPGPAVLNVPGDLGEADSGEPLPLPEPASPAAPDRSLLEKLHEAVQRARKPVVLAGTDVVRHGAGAELVRFVESIAAAVLVNMDARGVFPESHPRWAGVLVGDYRPGATVESEIVRQSDLVVLVGADAMMTHAPWGFTVPTCELVARAEYQTLSPEPRVRVDGDLKQSLAFLSGVSQPGFAESEIAGTVEEVVSHFARPPEARLAVHDVLEISRRVLPGDGILVTGSGAYIRIMEHLWPVERYGTYMGTSGGRTMGLMIPGALGAGLAAPDVPMMGLGADGSLLMRLGELEVFARTGVAMPLVIVNDQALGTIKARQRSRGLPDYALYAHPVDFAAVACACGLRGVTVDSPEGFETELKAAFEAKVATLIDTRVDPEPYRATFGASIGDLG